MARTTLRFLVGTAAAALAAVAVAGAAEAKPKKKPRISPRLYRAPLVLTSFLQNGRTDVPRNEVLVFKFSAVLKKKSVDSRTIRVLEQSSVGAKPTTGALIPQVNVVRFDPSRSQRNWEDARRRGVANVPGDNPAGFTSFSDFVVTVPGPSELHTLKNARGERILQSFNGTFRTSTNYADPFPGQPRFVGVSQSGNLGFEPPKSGSTGLVDEDAVIVLEFSEPIDINTMDPSTTVQVTRVATNELVPGTVRLDPNDRSGRKYQFVPSLGFGSDLANEAGWDILVILTQGITDLAGNPLNRPYQAPIFRTRYVPGKKSASVVTESFNNQVLMDPTTVTEGGEWNTTQKGFLVGGVATTYPAQNVSLWLNPPGITVAFTRQNDPLNTDKSQSGCPFPRPQGSRGQFLYTTSDVGAAGAIVSVGWGPSSNALFGAIHPEITLRCGHTSNTAVVADMDSNVNIGALVQTYKGPYDIPQAKNVKPSDPKDAGGVTRDPGSAGYVAGVTGPPTGYWLYPLFTTPFEWNGTNNLIFDSSCQPAPNCQIHRGGFVPSGIPFPNRRAIGTAYTTTAADFTVDTVVLDMSFNKRRRTTRAYSLWYQLASDTTTFGVPFVSPISQPGGVTVTIELEGADGKPDPLNPGGYIPNTSTGTGFTTNVALVDGHRFFRFKVTMAANLNTNQSATIASLSFPYVF